MAISKFLDPKYDLTFKRIFGSEKNKNILIHFLNDILGFEGEDSIQDVEFLTIINPEIESDMEIIVDVLCKDSRENRYIVQMLPTRDKGLMQRTLLYTNMAYFRQIGNYPYFKRVILIAILDCILFPKKDEYISTHKFFEVKTGGNYLKEPQYVFIELPKFTKSEVGQLENMVERWCFFFKHAKETSEGDLKIITEQGPAIRLAYHELDKSHWSEKDLAAYEEKRMDLYKEEGKKEGRAEVAKAMLDQGMNPNTIVGLTGLTIYEIEGLKQGPFKEY